MQKTNYKKYLIISILAILGTVYAAEVPLCSLPLSNGITNNNAKVEGDQDPGCQNQIKEAGTLLEKITKEHPNDSNLNIS